MRSARAEPRRKPPSCRSATPSWRCGWRVATSSSLRSRTSVTSRSWTFAVGQAPGSGSGEQKKTTPFFAPLFVATKHICQDRLRSNTTNTDLKKRAAFSLLVISQELLDHSFHEHVRARARGALRRRFSQLHVLPGGAAGGGAVGTLPVCCCDAICLCDTSICQDRLGTRQPTAMVVVFSLLFLSSFVQDGWHSFLLMIRYGVGE